MMSLILEADIKAKEKYLINPIRKCHPQNGEGGRKKEGESPFPRVNKRAHTYHLYILPVWVILQSQTEYSRLGCFSRPLANREASPHTHT